MKIGTIISGEYREWDHRELAAYLEESGSDDALSAYERQLGALPKWLSSDRLPIAFAAHSPVGHINFIFTADL